MELLAKIDKKERLICRKYEKKFNSKNEYMRHIYSNICKPGWKPLAAEMRECSGNTELLLGQVIITRPILATENNKPC